MLALRGRIVFGCVPPNAKYKRLHGSKLNWPFFERDQAVRVVRDLKLLPQLPADDFIRCTQH